jgi:hypothetical protein
MRRITTPLTAIILGTSLVLGAMALARVMGPPEPVGRAAQTFGVKGKVAGLYPGVRKDLRARVVNRFDHPIRVRKVTATVTSPTPACPASSIRVKPWRGSLRIPARSAKRVTLVVRMRPTAPNGCQGVRFRLRYGGKALRA